MMTKTTIILLKYDFAIVCSSYIYHVINLQVFHLNLQDSL